MNQRDQKVLEILRELSVLMHLDNLPYKTRPIAGGAPFDDGNFEMGSQVSVEAGLDSVSYFVRHRKSRMVWAITSSKSGALQSARELLLRLTQDDVTACVQAFHEEVRVAMSRLPVPADLAEAVAARDKPIPKRRRRIFEEAGGECFYCRSALELDGKWHIEHRMPRALNGTDAPNNLVAACVSCNMKKRDRTDVEFLEDTVRRGKAAAARLQST
jgi:hypothetical protein